MQNNQKITPNTSAIVTTEIEGRTIFQPTKLGKAAIRAALAGKQVNQPLKPTIHKPAIFKEYFSPEAVQTTVSDEYKPKNVQGNWKQMSKIKRFYEAMRIEKEGRKHDIQFVD